jgi:hypothetical protein
MKSSEARSSVMLADRVSDETPVAVEEEVDVHLAVPEGIHQRGGDCRPDRHPDDPIPHTG